MDEHIRQTVPFGPFSRTSSATSGSSSFSELSVWVLACPLTDIMSLGTAAFTFDDAGKEAPAAATSCCFCNAAYESRKRESALTRKANEQDVCPRMHSDPMFLSYQSTWLHEITNKLY